VNGAPTVAIIDYGMGNRRSVEKALEHVGAHVSVSRDKGALAAADALVLPGVGAFGAAMAALDALELIAPIRAAVAEGRPLLGICLGMQLLFERSSELGENPGLGLLPGEVTLLNPGSPALRIPHIGWNDVSLDRPSAVTTGLGESRAFYHVHSFAARPGDAADVVGTTEYGERFATIVARDNVFGVQFHPEKSSAGGLSLLGNFVNVCAHAVSAA
jgi:imidazole glycerol-phosphate synthase subunit HisH